MRILIVITSVPFAKDFNTIKNLIGRFAELGDEVSVFLAGNGSYYLLRPEVEELSKLAKFFFCSHSAHERGVNSVPSWAESSSTYNLSKMMGEYEKVIVFN
jgi:hypothetical protein